jgi:hypothetical protein
MKGLPGPETDLIFLNIDEVQKLANTKIKGELGAEIKKAFIFGCYTGLRIYLTYWLAYGPENICHIGT